MAVNPVHKSVYGHVKISDCGTFRERRQQDMAGCGTGSTSITRQAAPRRAGCRCPFCRFGWNEYICRQRMPMKC